jgi:SAM-dependent methyltransferase
MKSKPAEGFGVRKISLHDIAPDCEIFVNHTVYDLAALSVDKDVVDIGCGFGATRAMVEKAGGRWTGVEPFEGGAHTVIADAQNLPFADASFDVVLMNAVLEHIPDAPKAIAEASRILRKGGVFVGYAAYMECFHEISYSHLSFKAIEHYANINGMKLEKISGGRRFGIDYHLAVLFYPLPVNKLDGVIATCIRGIFKTKSWLALMALMMLRKKSFAEAKQEALLYYQVECLRQSNGFNFLIRKL